MFLGGVRSVCFSITKNLCNGENEIYFSKSIRVHNIPSSAMMQKPTRKLG